MIEAYTLFSGSSGNAVLVRSGRDCILMDAGKSRRALLAALSEAGVNPQDLSAVFITHEHSDHISALSQLAKRDGIPTHAAAASAEFLARDPYTAAVLVPHPVQFTVSAGALTVTSFPLPHDSLCHIGYRITDTDGDALCIATDMGCLTDAVLAALTGCRGAILESNHDESMLRTGPYPAYLKRRILSPTGHLSNTDCASLAACAVMHGVRRIALAHLSRENNTPDLAYRTSAAALDSTDAEELLVCARDRVTRIL